MFTAKSGLDTPLALEAAANPVSCSVPTSQIPSFRTLSRDECEALLARNNVGRIAFAVHDRVNIVPINYVYSDGWIYGRTTSATKLRQILRNRRIAFEMDEQSQLFEWRSVIVNGPLYVIQPTAIQHSRSVYRTAISLIRRLIPETLTEADPVPFRDQLFRIRAVEMSGRASSPHGGQRLVAAATRTLSESAHPESDEKLQEQALSAIGRLELPEAVDVHVDAFDGIVVLSGSVETARDRQAIEAAVLKIPSVVALVQELETELPAREEPMASELARAAVKQLQSPLNAVANGIKVVVEHGWLRLEGEVASQRARDDATRHLRTVTGSRGVIDRTSVAAKTE